MPLTPPVAATSSSDVAALSDPDLPDPWERQVAASGYCSRPVRLAGGVEVVNRATGEIRSVFSTAGEPDGVLLTGCGNRRASRCRSCSDTYRADTWQLVAAGLRGGKSLPESVAGHPRLFVTLTAPSFGPVHSRRETGGRARRCHPATGSCAHGRSRGCAAIHEERDERLGSPLCPDCFDYETAVLWNAVLPELWRWTTIYLHRALAARAGLSRAQLTRHVRIAFTKVAEYQARGVVHLHAVLRLDARPPTGQPDQVAPPPGRVHRRPVG